MKCGLCSYISVSTIIKIKVKDNRITVNGIVHCGNMMLICNEGSTMQLDMNPLVQNIIEEVTGKTNEQRYLEYGRQIQRLFEYNRNDWLGKRIIN